MSPQRAPKKRVAHQNDPPFLSSKSLEIEQGCLQKTRPQYMDLYSNHWSTKTILQISNGGALRPPHPPPPHISRINYPTFDSVKGPFGHIKEIIRPHFYPFRVKLCVESDLSQFGPIAPSHK